MNQTDQIKLSFLLCKDPTTLTTRQIQLFMTLLTLKRGELTTELVKRSLEAGKQALRDTPGPLKRGGVPTLSERG